MKSIPKVAVLVNTVINVMFALDHPRMHEALYRRCATAVSCVG